MTLITLGPEGTFSYDLAKTMDQDIILESSIGRVFASVIKTGIPGLVPIENSQAGGVVATMDGLMEYPIYITAEIYLPIHHTFASHSSMKDITVVFSHPQSHEQCSKYLDACGLPVIHTESNSASARAQKERPGSAAILSHTLAERYHIPILSENIENNSGNMTRFIRISHSPEEEKDPQKCSILIDPGENRAGLLYDLLSPFKETNVNLTRIESRPSKRWMGNYVFFLDVECDGAWKEALDRIQKITRIKHLGCYRIMEKVLCK